MTYDQDTISEQKVLDLLRQEIERNHESQAAFAQTIGVSRAFVSAVINGKTRPTKRVLRAIGVEEVTIYRRTAEPV